MRILDFKKFVKENYSLTEKKKGYGAKECKASEQEETAGTDVKKVALPVGDLTAFGNAYTSLFKDGYVVTGYTKGGTGFQFNGKNNIIYIVKIEKDAAGKTVVKITDERKKEILTNVGSLKSKVSSLAAKATDKKVEEAEEVAGVDKKVNLPVGDVTEFGSKYNQLLTANYPVTAYKQGGTSFQFPTKFGIDYSAELSLDSANKSIVTIVDLDKKKQPIITNVGSMKSKILQIILQPKKS